MAYESGTLHLAYDEDGTRREFDAAMLVVFQAKNGVCQRVALTMHPLAAAAQKPDFSGEWRLDWQASGMKESDKHERLTLKQQVDTLVMESISRPLHPQLFAWTARNPRTKHRWG